MIVLKSVNFMENSVLFVCFYIFVLYNTGLSFFFSNKIANMLTDLDATDIELLKLLQKDATFTNKEMAFKLNKSIATVHERIKKLKEQGYIKRVVAILDRKKINKSLIAFSQVLLKEHSITSLNLATSFSNWISVAAVCSFNKDRKSVV